MEDVGHCPGQQLHRDRSFQVSLTIFPGRLSTQTFHYYCDHFVKVFLEKMVEKFYSENTL